MRQLKAISPSSFAKFEKEPEQFFLSYLAPVRPPRDPQSAPASVGSAFDAYVKSGLNHVVFGKPNFEELFETQVEDHNKEFALDAGLHCFECYKHCGAYQELITLLEGAIEEPQFEFNADTIVDGVPIAGKPDARFVHRGGAHIILDWKVSGYCGKSAVSPNKGYALVRDGRFWKKPSRNQGKSHALYTGVDFLGIEVNKFYMEQVSIDWADQLSMYAWMMGEPVGAEEVVVCIDQIVAKPAGKNGLKDGNPLLRIANHKSRVSAAHQHGLVARLKSMWEATQSGHVFCDTDRETNDERIAKLSKQARWMIPDGSRDGDFLARCARESSSSYKAR